MLHLPRSLISVILAGVTRAETREEQEGWVAADFVALAHGPGLLISAVDFGEGEFTTLIILIGEVSPSRGQVLAVAAPRCIEFDKPVAVSSRGAFLAIDYQLVKGAFGEVVGFKGGSV